MEKYKIACVVDNGGSSFVRVKVPAKELEGKIIKIEGIEYSLSFDFFEVERGKRFIPEEVVKSYKVLWINWSFINSVAQIGLWQSQGLKVVVDFDDLPIYSENHPDYIGKDEKREFSKAHVIKYAAQADVVIVSTKPLKDYFSQYNKNTFVSYNFLPIGKEGFELRANENSKDLLNICIYGSVSHYPNWLLLKPVINRLAKNKEIAEKCTFNLIGYTENRFWREIESMFKKKKNLKINIIPAANAGSHLDLLKGMDVCLMPLEDIPFNICKSSLKLIELAIVDVLPLGGDIYANKEVSSLVVAKEPIEWEQSIVKLLNRDFYRETSKKVRDFNLADNKFDEKIEDLRNIFEAVGEVNFNVKMPDNVNIWSITYNDSQISEYQKYDNSHIRTVEQKSYLFEYNPILDIIDNKLENIDNQNFIGIFSYKFPLKTGLSKKILSRLLKENDLSGVSFINLCPRYWKSGADYLQFSYKQHPGIEEILRKCVENLGQDYFNTPELVNYSNFFLMKKEFWVEYVNKWIKPTIKYLEENPEMGNKDAQYLSGLKGEELKKYTGLDYYTMHSFVIERLILQYVAYKQGMNFSSVNSNNFNVLNLI